MGLPTISRGIQVRDDNLTTANWVTNSSANASSTLSTDGDNLTLSVVFTSAVNGNFGSCNITGAIPANTLTGASTKLIFRHSGTPGQVTNPTLTLQVSYTSGAPDIFQPIASTSLVVENFALTSGRTIASIIVALTANANLSGTFTTTWDFVLVCKEILTLPSVKLPITFGKQRNIVELPILGREGGVVQDLGSLTPDISIAGSLVSTATPNNYTADQWWQILTGLTIETGTIQTDGNPTWQWLTTDQIQAKVLVRNYQPRQPMGRQQYWDYSLLLKQFDVLGESTANLIGVIY